MTDTTVTETTTPETTEAPEGYGAWLGGTDHKSVGTFCLVIAFLFLLAGGGLAAAMRTQLVQPDLSVLARRPYLQLTTLHGTFSFFLFLLPAWVGIAFAIVPLQLGASRLALPRLAPMSVWLFISSGVALVASTFAHGHTPTAGWSLDDPIPLHGLGGRAVDLWILGVGLAAAALVLAAVNLLVTVLRMRAPGLTLARLPMFSWSVFVASAVFLLATPVLVAGLVLLFVDHHLGAHVFDARRAGDPLVWRTLFTFFAYPAMWATVLPALGVLCEIVPVFAKAPLFQRRQVGLGLAVAGMFAMVGWGSELAGDSAVPQVFFSVTSLLILGPVALTLLSLLGTIALSRRLPSFKAPLVQGLGLLSTLALALPAMAVMLALGTGRAGHASQWWVGAWHQLLVGGSTFGIVCALYYWAPKLWGRHLSAGLGGLQMLVLVLGVDLAFVPLLIVGAQGMRRHTPAYAASSWGPANLVSTIGAYLVVLAILLLLLNIFVSIVARRGREAEADPWEGDTLEWATTSPPPPHNFDALPEVRSERPLFDLRSAERAESPEAVETPPEREALPV